MSKSKIQPVSPEALYRAYGEPPQAEVNKNDDGAVIPLQTTVFATHCGPFLLRKGVPIVVDGPLRRELKIAGVIA